MSAPVHFLQWGSAEEFDDLKDVQELLKVERDINVRIWGDKIEEPDAERFLSKLKEHLTDPVLSILYIACHGTQAGLVFNDEGRYLITFDRFFDTIKSSNHDPEQPVVLIFGFCHAMDGAVERYAPNWVTQIAGFKNEPRPVEVCNLVAGLIADISDFGRVLGSNLPSKLSRDNFTLVMTRLVEQTLRKQPPRPGRFFGANMENVVIAVRRNEDDTWIRNGIQDGDSINS